MTKSQIADKIKDPRINNLGSLGAALVAAAKR
jgi:hypothetical protein